VVGVLVGVHTVVVVVGGLVAMVAVHMVVVVGGGLVAMVAVLSSTKPLQQMTMLQEP
jgi:hypothetical protein